MECRWAWSSPHSLVEGDRELSSAGVRTRGRRRYLTTRDNAQSRWSWSSERSNERKRTKKNCTSCMRDSFKGEKIALHRREMWFFQILTGLTTLKYYLPKTPRKWAKGCDFFEIKNREKLAFFILRIMGKVKNRGQEPKTTLHYTAIETHRKK